MDRNFFHIFFEIGIPTIGTFIGLVGIILYGYIYFKLYEENQLITLCIGILAFVFSSLEFVNIIVSHSNHDNQIGFYLYRIEQFALALTIFPWLIYVRNNLELNKNYHRALDFLYTLSVFLVAIIIFIGIIYPQSFISRTEAIDTLNETMQNSLKIRGKIGPLYVFRDFVVTSYMLLVISAFIYEIVVNKNYTKNVQYLILTSIIAIFFFDDFNGISVYQGRGDFLIFKNIPFSRITLAYIIYNIVIIHSSVNQFISSVFRRRNKQSYNFEEIRAQDTVIINTAFNTSKKMLEFKDDFQKAVKELTEDVSNAYSSVSALKTDIGKTIDSINEFITIENFQVNDANSNIEKINELIETYPKLKETSTAQQTLLTDLNSNLQESIGQIYDLQEESVNILDKFYSFQKSLDKEKFNIENELGKSLGLGHLNTQINKIIGFMGNISDRAKTLAINSGIQASKSGDWTSSFEMVSNSVSELVIESLTVSERMRKLLYQIEDIFKRFNSASVYINNSVIELTQEIAAYYDKLSRFNRTMERQNDFNMNIAKNTDKMFESVSDIDKIIKSEENDFMNIRFRIEEFNNYIMDISEKAAEQNAEVKNLMRDMNKLLATSEDLESVSGKLNDEKEQLLEYSDNLDNIIREHSKTT